MNCSLFSVDRPFTRSSCTLPRVLAAVVVLASLSAEAAVRVISPAFAGRFLPVTEVVYSVDSQDLAESIDSAFPCRLISIGVSVEMRLKRAAMVALPSRTHPLEKGVPRRCS